MCYASEVAICVNTKDLQKRFPFHSLRLKSFMDVNSKQRFAHFAFIHVPMRFQPTISIRHVLLCSLSKRKCHTCSSCRCWRFKLKLTRIFLHQSFTVAKREEYFVKMLCLVLLLYMYLRRSCKDVCWFLREFLDHSQFTVQEVRVVKIKCKSYLHCNQNLRASGSLNTFECTLLEYFRNVSQRQILACTNPPVWFLPAFYWLHALHFKTKK